MSSDEKLFYTIGEAAQIVEVKPYVLRYWEGEFKKLNPQKSETGQRTYRTKDLQTALAIKKLLYEDKYTIAGAVQKLEEMEISGFPTLDPDRLGSSQPPQEGPESPLPEPNEPRSRPMTRSKEKIEEFIEKLAECRGILARHLP